MLNIILFVQDHELCQQCSQLGTVYSAQVTYSTEDDEDIVEERNEDLDDDDEVSDRSDEDSQEDSQEEDSSDEEEKEEFPPGCIVWARYIISFFFSFLTKFNVQDT